VNILSKDAHIGGTGTNIAVIAASLGVPTALCGFVGNDFPKEFADIITSKGVITDEFIVQDGYQTAQAIMINDSKNDQRSLFYQGPQGSASSLDRRLLKNAGMSEYVHFSTGEPDYYLDLMRSLKGGKGKISFDPAQEIHWVWDKKRFMEALGMCDILFCNKFESASVLRYTSAGSLSGVAAKMLVRTEGVEGSQLYVNGEVTEIPVVPAKRTADATGAGDAYRAGFYAGKYNGYSDTDSLIIGAATASFVVEETGALTNIPAWDAVMERAERYLRR
jgi:sugar/nucleoside kinase (ribokinase family)